MISKLSIVLAFTLAILTSLTESSTGDAVQVKLRYNLDFQALDSEVQEMLKKADLESHGFNLEVSSKKLVKEPGTYTPEYQESYFYYKIVNCSKTQKVEQELDTLIPGIFGDNVASKVNKKTKHTENMGQCRVGLELIFKKPGYGNGRQTVDMDDTEEADEFLGSYGTDKASLHPKTPLDMDEPELVNDGSLKVNSGIRVGKKVNNFWGGRRRRRFIDFSYRRRFYVGSYGTDKASLRPKTPLDMDEPELVNDGSLKVNSGIKVGKKVNNFWGGRRRRRFIDYSYRRRFYVGR